MAHLAMDKVLRDKISLIKDPSLKHHYGQAIKDLRWQLFRPQSGERQPWRGRKPAPVRASTKTSPLAATGEGFETNLREAVILAILIRMPDLIPEFEGRMEDMRCTTPDYVALRDLVLRYAHLGEDTLQHHIDQQMGPEVVETLLARPHVSIIPAVRRTGDSETARQTLIEEFAKLDAAHGLRAEISEATEDMAGQADETVTYRLGEAARAHQNATSSLQEDQTEYEIGSNGAPISRSEKDAFDSLLENIGLPKGP